MLGYRYVLPRSAYSGHFKLSIRLLPQCFSLFFETGYHRAYTDLDFKMLSEKLELDLGFAGRDAGCVPP